MLFLHFGLLLATPCLFPSLSLQLSHPTSSITYSDLLCPLWASLPQDFWGSSDSGIFPSPSKGPARPSLPNVWDSHSCPTLLEVRG